MNSSRFGANHLSAPSAGLSLFHLQFCLLASCCCFAAVAAVASSASARHLFEEVPFVACRLMAHRPVCRPRFRFGCPRCLCRHELRMRRRCPLFELFPSRLPKKNKKIHATIGQNLHCVWPVRPPRHFRCCWIHAVLRRYRSAAAASPTQTALLVGFCRCSNHEIEAPRSKRSRAKMFCKN